MKLWVQVEDREFQVEVRDSGDRRVVFIDGEEVDLVLQDGGPGVYTLMVNGQPVDVAAVPRRTGYAVTVRGVPFEVQLQDERQRRIAAQVGAAAVAEGKVLIRAPMPGLVKLVEIRPGDEVAKGQRLVVLEAMKMENDLTAPRAGKVEKVLADEGQKVEQGQNLVILE